ncbi:hypothetical protein ACRAWF_09025 [Streptomyces sp. L7]
MTCALRKSGVRGGVVGVAHARDLLDLLQARDCQLLYIDLFRSDRLVIRGGKLRVELQVQRIVLRVQRFGLAVGNFGRQRFRCRETGSAASGCTGCRPRG